VEQDFLAAGKRGVGLENVERRIRLHGGDGAVLSIHSAPGHGTVAEIRLPIEADASEELAVDTTMEQRP
jgi:sensor histidine kinase YesM